MWLKIKEIENPPPTETLPRPGPGAPIEITTPAGQSRVTHAPDPPGGRLAAPTIRVDLFWPRAA